MRPSRVFRLLFRIFITLLTISVTTVSILGGLSAVLILSNQDNFGVDTDEATFYLEINNSTLKIENANFSLPFNLTNTGYFDLEDLQVGVKLGLNYSHIVNATLNETRVVELLDVTRNFGNINKGATEYYNFSVSNSSFLHHNFPDPLDVDWFRGPPALEFYANFTISLVYSIGMHALSITIINIKVGEYSPF
ncbi:MAG: hypothetical protein ACFE94_10705 [Candidatus Hodarchaeota archaeon]